MVCYAVLLRELQKGVFCPIQNFMFSCMLLVDSIEMDL